MKGCTGRSWRDFGQVEVAPRRSAAWIDLLGSQSGPSSCNSSRLSLTSSTSSSMFLDSIPRSNSGLTGACIPRKPWETSTHPYGGFMSPPAECNRRAALDFVLELAGPRTPSSAGEKLLGSDAYVCGDELPVPMFAVDRDLHCTLWNRRLEELSNWSEGEVMAMETFPSCTFEPCLGPAQKRCDDILKNALFGRDVSGADVMMRTKNGAAVRVVLFASLRTDAVGAVSGVLCVVMPQQFALPTLETSECREEAEAEVAGAPEADEGRSSGSYSELSDFSVACTTEPSTPLVRTTGSDEFVAPLHRGDAGDAFNLQDMKDRLERSVSAPESSAATGSTLGSPKALVVDGFSARRNSLAMQLERCGMEVACASSAREAAWRFGQSLTDKEEGPAYSVVFVDLQAESKDGYAAVREVRRLENVLRAAGDGDLTTLIVAITSMNRWDLAGMDTSMDKSMTAGVNAVIPQNIKMQQLRSTLRKLGVRSKYLEVPTTLPRALSGQFHNPLNLSR